MSFEVLKQLNKHIVIKHITDDSFRKYGRIINSYDFSELVNYMNKNTIIPKEGNVYVASDMEMEDTPICQTIKREFYGEMPIEVGYCNGMNSTLNGLEYHKSSEINIAVTDLLLMLGKLQDINNNNFNSKNIEIFYLPKGIAVELYATTLHFSPCRAHSDGFKAIVILPKGTNMPLEAHQKIIDKEGELLFAKNKWLLVHPSRSALIEKGAHVGIYGENIAVNIE